MCGIAGEVGHEPGWVTGALERMVHRGPDAGDAWADPEHPVALGHRRLSIIDLEGGQLDPNIFRSALRGLEQRFDAAWGGFGDAPKFPQPMALLFLLHRVAAGDISSLTVYLQSINEK